MGGMIAGLIALGIFVLFSGWVVAERLRANRQDQGDD
jgi:hypothetical protein